ncbi:glycosyltransferase family 4 protein [Candidatus Pacearchaeota archaeon]|nr:glycosyltransferase family 4 protein [Candidatus Staskawiczbacteria bacterium]MBM3230109.1 glycosyltransferase family 4 protein [Candidatus Pacearchaeota archaeon]
MKILELTTFSAGGCGVWRRVQQEATLLASRGHQVTVFSTNRVKGEPGTAEEEEKQGKVVIKRFPAWKLGGESYMHWNCLSDILTLKPDVIIAHSYRHTHTHIALQAKKKLGCKVFLVTHAPFGRENSRGLFGNLAVSFYDTFRGPQKLKQFDGIFTIAHWEEPYLEKLGVPKEKLTYLPNGIDTAFFSKTKTGSGNDALLFLGRIAPIKQIETVLEALSSLPLSKRIPFTIVGPGELSYTTHLRSLISKLGLSDMVTLTDTSYTATEARTWLDSHRYFILPSKSEGMPQALVEAMARGRVVIGSNNSGNTELIQSEQNGFLYTNGDTLALASLLTTLPLSSSACEKLGSKAYRTARGFVWETIIDKMERIL